MGQEKLIVFTKINLQNLFPNVPNIDTIATIFVEEI